MVQSDPIKDLEKLNSALRDVFDLFEKLAGVPCLLLGETAKTVKKGQLDVPVIQVGIRELELTPFRKTTIYTHLADYLRRGTSKSMHFEPEPKLDKTISYDFNGIPIEILVIDKDYPQYKNLSPIMYNYDYYNLPNPLDET